MKTRMLERLDRLAEINEAKSLQEIVRHTKTLDHVARQRGLLAAYREKLRESWRGGLVIEAGAAKRAADFVGASARAEQQIEQMERQASQQLELARQGFAQARERRRGLEAAKQAVIRSEAHTKDQRLERAQPLAVPKRWRSP
jgi:flagellar biosynthesis chaperone FliJ